MSLLPVEWRGTALSQRSTDPLCAQGSRATRGASWPQMLRRFPVAGKSAAGPEQCVKVLTATNGLGCPVPTHIGSRPRSRPNSLPYMPGMDWPVLAYQSHSPMPDQCISSVLRPGLQPRR